VYNSVNFSLQGTGHWSSGRNRLVEFAPSSTNFLHTC